MAKRVRMLGCLERTGNVVSCDATLRRDYGQTTTGQVVLVLATVAYTRKEAGKRQTPDHPPSPHRLPYHLMHTYPHTLPCDLVSYLLPLHSLASRSRGQSAEMEGAPLTTVCVVSPSAARAHER
jgi:hypothetical protein